MDTIDLRLVLQYAGFLGAGQQYALALLLWLGSADAGGTETGDTIVSVLHADRWRVLPAFTISPG